MTTSTTLSPTHSLGLFLAVAAYPLLCCGASSADTHSEQTPRTEPSFHELPTGQDSLPESATRTLQEEPQATFRFLIGGLWAFAKKGAWILPPKPDPTYNEIQVWAINSAKSRDKTLCKHHPVLIFKKEHLLISEAYRIGRRQDKVQPSHFEALIFGESELFDVLVLPLQGRLVTVETQAPAGVTVPHQNGFLSTIDMDQSDMGSNPSSLKWWIKHPKPKGLMGAKIVMDLGEIENVRMTAEKIYFQSDDNTNKHKQRYGTHVTWSIKANSHLRIVAAGKKAGVADEIVIDYTEGDAFILLSNFCEAAHTKHKLHADDVRAFYDLANFPRIPIKSRSYPRDLGDTGSAGDFCPPARLSLP